MQADLGASGDAPAAEAPKSLRPLHLCGKLLFYDLCDLCASAVRFWKDEGKAEDAEEIAI